MRKLVVGEDTDHCKKRTPTPARNLRTPATTRTPSKDGGLSATLNLKLLDLNFLLNFKLYRCSVTSPENYYMACW